MSRRRSGRQPEKLDVQELAKERLDSWFVCHYGTQGRPRMPEAAQGLANGAAIALHDAIETKRAGDPDFAREAALAFELLAEAELQPDGPIYLDPEPWDRLTYLQRLGSRVAEKRQAAEQRLMTWFFIGGVAGFVLARLLS